VQLPPGTKVTQVRGGCNFTVALTSKGQVLTWGDNTSGQLGIGTTGGESTTPVQVHLPAGTTVTAVRAGCAFVIALTSDGSVLTWGDNTFGQPGDGTTVNRSTPVFPNLPPGIVITAISAGASHSLALASNHLAIYAWRRNQFGQLGNDATTDSSTPVLVGTAVSKFVGLAATFGDSYALTTDGRVLSWGDNTFGELGTTVSLPSTPNPVFVATPAGVKVSSLAAGGFHVLARTSTGHVLGWGFNDRGQVGDGTTTDRFQPVPVTLPGNATVTALAAGSLHSVALTTTGKVFAWGGVLRENSATTPSPIAPARYRY